MYNLYIDWLTDNGSTIEPVSDHYYRDIFNSEFNIGFERPHCDTCSTCDLYNNTIRGLRICDNLLYPRLFVHNPWTTKRPDDSLGNKCDIFYSTLMFTSNSV